MNTQEIFLKHVCPALGTFIAFIVFMSPMKAVLEVNRTKQLGELNALPFLAMVANCITWILYGFVIRDFYVYCANVPGMVAGLFYVFVCFKFSKEQAQDMLRNIFMGITLLLFIVGLADLAAAMDSEGQKKLWGSTAVTVLAIYYSAPLSSVAKVVAQRDSSSLHFPLCLMNTINGVLWFAYGLALKDWFICFPNGIGAGFNIICLVFCFVFPAKGRSRLGGQLNPAANWSVLRLQSVRYPAGSSGAAAAAAAAANGSTGGFFDLTQFKWRQQPSEFFRRLSSRLSFGRFNSSYDVRVAAGAADHHHQHQQQQQVEGSAEGKDVIAAADGSDALGAARISSKEMSAAAQQDDLGGTTTKKIPAVAAADVEQGPDAV